MDKKAVSLSERVQSHELSPAFFRNREHHVVDQQVADVSVGYYPQQRRADHPEPYRRGILKDQRGVTIAEFLIVFLILTFFVFGALDYWTILAKHQYAEHVMHKYLQRMQVEGRLSTADEGSLMSAFVNFGCHVENITAQRESQGQPRILRNPDDLNGSTVNLKITCRPVPQPLLTGRMIRGNVPGSGFRIMVGGSMLSERVVP